MSTTTKTIAGGTTSRARERQVRRDQILARSTTAAIRAMADLHDAIDHGCPIADGALAALPGSIFEDDAVELLRDACIAIIRDEITAGVSDDKVMEFQRVDNLATRLVNASL